MSWNKYIAGTVVCLAMLLSSCRSTKSITDVTPESTARTEQIVSALNGKKVESSRPLTAKLSLELQMGGKGVTVGGNLKMKKDEAIQMSVSAFLWKWDVLSLLRTICWCSTVWENSMSRRLIGMWIS